MIAVLIRNGVIGLAGCSCYEDLQDLKIKEELAKEKQV